MGDLTVLLDKPLGTIRLLHGVNNGPQNDDPFFDLTDFYRQAGFPHARLHDCHYPSPDVVDIPQIFPNFHADADDPANYHFGRTDDFLASIVALPAKIIYRLGTSIEHTTRKYHVHPPADYDKWVKICINVIRHYNQGWADGFEYGINYWEIWNEPDVRPEMWSGADEQYFALYAAAARGIKALDSSLKVGGPVVTFYRGPMVERFLAFVRDHRLPLDFFSWHMYDNTPQKLLHAARDVRGILNQYGFQNTEMHLNEWHYLNVEWKDLRPGDSRLYHTVRAKYERMVGPESAAFCASALMLLQDTAVDVANYYAADLSHWSMFDNFGVPSKTFYAFVAFNELLKTPLRVACTGWEEEGPVTACAGVAPDGASVGLLVSNFSSTEVAQVVSLAPLPWKGPASVEVRAVDAAHDFETTQATTVDAAKAKVQLALPPYSVAFVKICKP